MTEEIIRLVEQSAGFPLLTAFLLGLLASVNPCQLAINLSALTWLFGRKETKDSRWQTGLIYLTGRFVAFFVLGWGCVWAITYFGIRLSSSRLMTLDSIYKWVEIILPWLLMAVGLFFLYRAFHVHKHDGSCHNSSQVIHRGRRFGPFWLGLILAFLFCPESAVVFFGMMVPLGAATSVSWSVPLVYALSSLIPFVLLLWMVHHANAFVSRYEDRVARIQVWVNVLLGLLFILLAVAIWVMG